MVVPFLWRGPRATLVTRSSHYVTVKISKMTSYDILYNHQSLVWQIIFWHSAIMRSIIRASDWLIIITWCVLVSPNTICETEIVNPKWGYQMYFLIQWRHYYVIKNYVIVTSSKLFCIIKHLLTSIIVASNKKIKKVKFVEIRNFWWKSKIFRMSQNGHLNSPAIGLNSPSLALNFEKRPNFGQILEIDPIRAFFLTFIYGKTKIFNTIRPRQKPAVKMNSSNTKSRIMFFSKPCLYSLWS